MFDMTFLYLFELTLNDHFLQVIINFPDPAHKSDIVQLRGPKNEVEKCTKYMQKMVADLVRETLSGILSSMPG